MSCLKRKLTSFSECLKPIVKIGIENLFLPERDIAIPVAILNITSPRIFVERFQEDDISQVSLSSGSRVLPVSDSFLEQGNNF